jgi:endonuclease YncB( thermonuclease family)
VRLLLALAVTALAACGQQAPFSGKVTSVADGDTIEVLDGRTPRRIRLFGVDTPEQGQAFGDRARRRTSELVMGATVTVRPKGVDQFKRILAAVVLPDGRILNEVLVTEGLAWWFRRYAPRDRRLESLEEKARDARLGLWAEADPTPPWLWRRDRKRK